MYVYALSVFYCTLSHTACFAFCLRGFVIVLLSGLGRGGGATALMVWEGWGSHRINGLGEVWEGAITLKNNANNNEEKKRHNC